MESNTSELADGFSDGSVSCRIDFGRMSSAGDRLRPTHFGHSPAKDHVVVADHVVEPLAEVVDRALELAGPRTA